jgi:hypothetical protein
MIERLAVVESTIPRVHDNTDIAKDLFTFVEAGIGGISLYEHELPVDCDLRLNYELFQSGLRLTTAHPTAGSILPPPGKRSQNPDERIDSLCHSLRRLAPLDPIAVAIPVAPAGSTAAVSGNDDILKAIRKIARAGALLHPHSVNVALLSDSLGCDGATLRSIVEKLRAPNLRVVLEISKVGGRRELEQWARDLSLVAAARLRVSVGNPPLAGLAAMFQDDDLSLESVVAMLHNGGYRGFYEVEFELMARPGHVSPPPKYDLKALLLATKSLIRAALGQYLNPNDRQLRAKEEIDG